MPVLLHKLPPMIKNLPRLYVSGTDIPYLGSNGPEAQLVEADTFFLLSTDK